MSGVQIPIQTERLTLRPLKHADAERLAVLAGDFDVARQTARIPHPFSPDQARQWIASLERGDEVVYGIELQGRLIGTSGYKTERPGVMEIGYWLGRDYWGQGYAYEAASHVLHAIFEDTAAATVIAGHANDNPASGRIIEKLGFAPLGDTIHRSEARDEDVRCQLYELHRVDYVKRSSR